MYAELTYAFPMSTSLAQIDKSDERCAEPLLRHGHRQHEISDDAGFRFAAIVSSSSNLANCGGGLANLLLSQSHSSRPIHTLPPTPLLCIDRICMLTS